MNDSRAVFLLNVTGRRRLILKSHHLPVCGFYGHQQIPLFGILPQETVIFQFIPVLIRDHHVPIKAPHRLQPSPVGGVSLVNLIGKEVLQPDLRHQYIGAGFRGYREQHVGLGTFGLPFRHSAVRSLELGFITGFGLGLAAVRGLDLGFIPGFNLGLADVCLLKLALLIRAGNPRLTLLKICLGVLFKNLSDG